MSTTFRSPSLRRLGHLFNGADAGHYTLPQRITAIRAAHESATVEQAAQAAQVDTMTGHDLIDAIKEAARTGKRWPSATRLAEADQERPHP